MTNWNQIVFVTKLLLVKDSCNMGANNTITTASSSSSGAPRRPTSFLTRNTCFSLAEMEELPGEGEVFTKAVSRLTIFNGAQAIVHCAQCYCPTDMD